MQRDLSGQFTHSLSHLWSTMKNNGNASNTMKLHPEPDL